jgi:polyisoprenoid-binding protein YceI
MAVFSSVADGKQTNYDELRSEQMKRFDQSSAVCQVFIYKEGLLSTVSYDLRINVTSFVIDLDENEHFLKARFAADSLRVDCAIVDGEEKYDILNSWEKGEIERIMIRNVLDAGRYKDFLLTSSSITKEDSTYSVKAVLALHGTEREIAFTAKNGGEYYLAEVQLYLPDYGIKPFSTLFGAIKIKPDVLIRVQVPHTPVA